MGIYIIKCISAIYPPPIIFYDYYLQKEYIITIFVMNKVAYVAVQMPSTAHI